ncbi:MAG: hypothetical protein ABEN55_01010 [Bradymonadaceae bacterium]
METGTADTGTADVRDADATSADGGGNDTSHPPSDTSDTSGCLTPPSTIHPEPLRDRIPSVANGYDVGAVAGRDAAEFHDGTFFDITN